MSLQNFIDFIGPVVKASWLNKIDQAVNGITGAQGSALIPYLPAGTGAIVTDVQTKLRETLDAIDDFGCDNTGATDTTTQLLAFYMACISSGNRGFIRKGTYKVTTGVLIFDNGNTNKAWPHIETDGYGEVTFSVNAATATNAPILQWKNGTKTGAASYWLGGSHGGVTFSDATGATALLRSAISMMSMWGTKFGYMKGSTLCGDVVTIPQNLDGGTNPDPYACSDITFDAIDASNCAGLALNNLNWLGMDSWEVHYVRCIGGTGGVFGIGSGCRIGAMSMGSIVGWAFDDGCNAANTGGSPQRNVIGVAELDNCKWGIRINKSSRTDFNKIRFIHRYQTSPNATALY